jgi:hypothetical protein
LVIRRREQWVAKAAASNAEPGMYPWGDAVARWERVDGRRREWRSFSAVLTMDAAGNVTVVERGPESPQESVPAMLDRSQSIVVG